MEAGNPGDEELWEACRKLPADWEPHGQRRWQGRREARPDCDTCRWFVGLLRTSPDWGACANPESARAGLLTFREQGCWHHEPENRSRRHENRSSRCDYVRRFEKFLRELAAAFVKEEVRRANDPLAEEPHAPVPERLRRTVLSAVVRRILRHAAADFSRQAFRKMAARTRSDTRRYWTFARCHLSRTVGEEISEIRLPENMRELEDKFWRSVDSTIGRALRGREPKLMKKRRRAG